MTGRTTIETAAAASSARVPGGIEGEAVVSKPDLVAADLERDGGAEHLGDLVPLIRERLQLEAAFEDDLLLASLREIAASGDRTERWRAAFNSTLGQWLGLRGRDLNTTLSTLVTLLPPARS